MRSIAPLLLLLVALPAHANPLADAGIERPSHVSDDDETPPRDRPVDHTPTAIDHARSQKTAGKVLVGLGAVLTGVGVAAGIANLTVSVGEAANGVGAALGSIFGPPTAAEQAQFEAQQRDFDHQRAVTQAVALSCALAGVVLAGSGAAAWVAGARKERRAYQLEFGVTPSGVVGGITGRF